METLHAFAGNPIIPGKRSASEALELLDSLVAEGSSSLKVLPLCQGKPLVDALDSGSWRLAWQTFAACQAAAEGASKEKLVYLGEEDSYTYFAFDATSSKDDENQSRTMSLRSISQKFTHGDAKLGFVDLRTLMVAADDKSLPELSIAGHARALLEWHSQVKFCGRCGMNTEPCDAGQRRRCTRASCRSKYYPRIDPVVIMLVIDKERDRVLLGHQSKYVPRMWSCLAGFVEPGESLDEAVRRETREESGVEVGKIVYHSSQPWPLGTSNMPCQIMVGFFAFATTFDVQVDKKELEDARWYSHEEVQNALVNSHSSKAQQAAQLRVLELCRGEAVESGVAQLRVAGGEGDGIFVPGPYAIAHHLISTWASKGSEVLFSRI